MEHSGDRARPWVWLQALKPASWPKMLVPMALGQALGFSACGVTTPGVLGFGLIFTVLDAVFIVLLNDWADSEVDGLKRRLFPASGSPKTIPDGLLRPGPVLGVALLAGGFALLLAVLGERWLERPYLGSAGAVCLLVFVLYSLPPARLNYRGGGEVLEALGVGLALPLLQVHSVAGVPSTEALVWLPGFVVLSFASAAASGLSDEESDRAGGKRTLASLLGNRIARRAVEVSVAAGLVLWLLIPAAATGPSSLVPAGLAVAVGAILAWPLRLASPLAVTGAWDAQRHYKAHLHRAIWGGALALAAGLVVSRVVMDGP